MGEGKIEPDCTLIGDGGEGSTKRETDLADAETAYPGEGRPVDILYVVGKGSVANDWELRYSLRSVERFANPESIGRVIVVGRPPQFLSDSVMRLEIPDIPGKRKHWNIINCISTAVKELGIDRPFLYSSDDHFLAAPADFRRHPVFCRFQFKDGLVFGEKEFDDWAKRKNINVKPSKYQKCLIATRAVLEAEGLPAFWTSWHGNTWMFPDCIDEAASLYAKYADRFPTPFGYEPTIMINAIRAKRLMDSQKHIDFVRLPRDVKSDSLSVIQKLAVEEGWFSVGDKAWLDTAFRAFMFGLYMRPCRYEK